MAAKLISIIGPVAVGKTTLAECLAAQLPAEILYEDYAGNPFLAGSFTGRDELMLPSQLYFLLGRVGQLSLATWPDAGVLVSDYGFSQDRLFAAASLARDDLKTYDYLSAKLARLVRQPDVLIHLDASVETLLGRIARRGRAYEAAFDADFLGSMARANAEISPPSGCKLIKLNAETIDFRNAADATKVAQQIRQALDK